MLECGTGSLLSASPTVYSKPHPTITMLTNLHPKAKRLVIEHLYWNEFPFKLEFQYNVRESKGQRNREARLGRHKEGPQVRNHFAPILADATYRVNRLGYTIIYYLKDQATAQAMVNATPSFLNLARVTQPLNNAHIEYLIANPNRVTRSQPYHGIYHYATSFTGGYRDILKLREWSMEYVKERGSKSVKFVFKNEHHVDVFLRDEIELMMIKLVHGGHMGKIKHVHILNKNNNKAGISDEPHSFSETT